MQIFICFYDFRFNWFLYISNCLLAMLRLVVFCCLRWNLYERSTAMCTNIWYCSYFDKSKLGHCRFFHWKAWNKLSVVPTLPNYALYKSFKFRPAYFALQSFWLTHKIYLLMKLYHKIRSFQVIPSNLIIRFSCFRRFLATTFCGLLVPSETQPQNLKDSAHASLLGLKL